MNLLRGENLNRSMQIRKKWARHLLYAIGVRMEVRGEPPKSPCLIMGNHRSYLDPVVLIHDVVACPVSKAEVSKWPIIGYGAKVTGILFLKRESVNSRKKTLEGIGDQVKNGTSVILFPEGTTHADPQCRSLKPGGFKLAAAENFPVVPVAIEYGNEADYWIGNDTFLPHFLRRFSEKTMKVYVRYGTPMQHDDAEFLRTQTQNWIDKELKEIRNHF